MSITISNKAIILTDYKNLLHLINGILPEINIDLYSGDSSLSSLDSLKNRLIEKGDLTFLKKDILSFLDENGYPIILMIDMKINIDLDADNKSNKVLKTLLLAYLIIIQGEEYKNVFCNIVILMNKKDYNDFKVTHKHPQDILSILKTSDERLNNIIHEYTTNNEKFKKNFNILLTDAEQEPSLIKSELVLFINMIKAKEKLKHKLMQEKPATVSPDKPKIDAAQSADVVLRSGNIFFKNGDAPEDYDHSLNLIDKEVYILGYFTSFTRLDVIDRLLRLLKTGFGNEINFRKGDSLTLNIPGESVIDSTTPITLAQLISKELRDYKNLKIRTTALQYQQMQQYKGFNMIQKNVIIEDDSDKN